MAQGNGVHYLKRGVWDPPAHLSVLTLLLRMDNANDKEKNKNFYNPNYLIESLRIDEVITLINFCLKFLNLKATFRPTANFETYDF